MEARRREAMDFPDVHQGPLLGGRAAQEATVRREPCKTPRRVRAVRGRLGQHADVAYSYFVCYVVIVTKGVGHAR